MTLSRNSHPISIAAAPFYIQVAHLVKHDCHCNNLKHVLSDAQTDELTRPHFSHVFILRLGRHSKIVQCDIFANLHEMHWSNENNSVLPLPGVVPGLGDSCVSL